MVAEDDLDFHQFAQLCVELILGFGHIKEGLSITDAESVDHLAPTFPSTSVALAC